MNIHELAKLHNEEKVLLRDIAKSTQGAMDLINRARDEFGMTMNVNDAISALAKLNMFAKLKLQNT